MSEQFWTPELVLDSIRRLHEAGNDLSYANASELAPRLVSAAGRCFGNWGSAVAAAGFDYRALARTAHNRSRAKRAKWSKERIQGAADRKEPLQATVVSRMYPDLYGAACNPRYFGGWAKALAASGIKAERLKPGRLSEHAASLARWKADLLFERITQLAEQITTVPASTIRRVARELATTKPAIVDSWSGPGHHSNGTQGAVRYAATAERCLDRF